MDKRCWAVIAGPNETCTRLRYVPLRRIVEVSVAMSRALLFEG